MKTATKFHIPRIVLTTITIAFFVMQWLFGEFPAWIFSYPMNILVGALWLVLIWEGYRHRTTSAIVQYLLSAEATYIALAVATTIAIVLGLQSEPATISWPVIGGFIFVQTVLTLVILRGWRNNGRVRWRFLFTHCGLWLAATSMLLGAADKEVLRVEIDNVPTREAITERGEKRYLDYELRLEKFDIEQSKDGTPKQFRATVAVNDKIVDIEVNSPYSHRYGEDIYLVSYTPAGCVLQIVYEPWRVITTIGIAILLLGAFILFLQGFQNRE